MNSNNEKNSKDFFFRSSCFNGKSLLAIKKKNATKKKKPLKSL